MAPSKETVAVYADADDDDELLDAAPGASKLGSSAFGSRADLEDLPFAPWTELRFLCFFRHTVTPSGAL